VNCITLRRHASGSNEPSSGQVLFTTHIVALLTGINDYIIATHNGMAPITMTYFNTTSNYIENALISLLKCVVRDTFININFTG